MLGGAGLSEGIKSAMDADLFGFAHRLLDTMEELGFDGIDLDVEAEDFTIDHLILLAQTLREKNPDVILTHPGGTLEYVIARIEFTNDLGYDLTPDVSHFFLIDRNNNRYQAKDSGSSVFTGVSNSTMPLKMNEKREYTVGFRTTDLNIAGTIFYER